ncbi:MAG: matrixin family metalloprotease [Polyangiales bacterium]
MGMLATAWTPMRAFAWCQSHNVAQSTPGVCQTEGVPLGWNRRCIGYGVDLRGTEGLDFEQVKSIAIRAFRHWTSVDCGVGTVAFDIQPYAEPAFCSKAEFNRFGRNVNTLAFVTDWENRASASGVPYDSNAIAITTTSSTSSGEILDADILINENFAPFAECADSGCTGDDVFRIDLESIITHEIGHFFGIAHSADPQSTMWFDYGAGSIEPRSLSPDDEAALCGVYPPGIIQSTTCTLEPLGGLALDCEPKRLLGTCALQRSRDTEPAWVLFALGSLVWMRTRRRRQR